MMWHGTFAVFRFELRRTVTISRVAVWLLLTSFPIFIVGVIKYNEDRYRPIGFDGPRGKGRTVTLPLGKGEFYSLQVRRIGSQRVATVTKKLAGLTRSFDNVVIPDNMELPRSILELGNTQIRGLKDGIDELLVQQSGSIRELSPDGQSRARPKIPDFDWGVILFGLIPEVITLFGLLLWVTPVVQAELEGRTWIYLAVRPRGRASMLLGKYLTAITWTALSGCVSATVCVWVAEPEEALRMWSTIVALVGFACLAYGSLYSLIGVFLHRRAMVIAVAYTLIFEFLVSFVPAVINQFTVQYRLRNLLIDFMDWRNLLPKEEAVILLGNQPAWLHVLVLIGVTIAVLVFATQVIQRKEYATADEA